MGGLEGENIRSSAVSTLKVKRNVHFYVQWNNLTKTQFTLHSLLSRLHNLSSHMKKAVVSLLAFATFSSAAVHVVAQTDCQEVQREDGQFAYEQCLRKNRDEELKLQIASYKTQLQAEQDRIKAYYKNLKEQMELSSKQFDLDRNSRISFLEYQLSRYEKKSDDYKRIRQQMDDLKAEQKSVKRYKDAYKDVLSSREKMETSRLSLQLVEYEQQVRGYPVIFSRPF